LRRAVAGVLNVISRRKRCASTPPCHRPSADERWLRATEGKKTLLDCQMTVVHVPSMCACYCQTVRLSEIYCSI